MLAGKHQLTVMTDIDVLLQENRKFEPSEEFRSAALISSDDIYERAGADPESYWASEAVQLEWMKPWDEVLKWKPPHAEWFAGGKLNVAVNCIDRHIRTARRNKAALVWEGEPGDRRTLTYWDLYCEVNKFANVLRELGVKKGDRVAIYLPMIPEAAISMLACARIGAIHSVVFGGFSPESLRDRINDAQAKVLITADGGYRRGQIIPLKRNADKALEETQGKIKLAGNINNPITLFSRGPAEVRFEAQRAIDAGIQIIAPECAVPLQTTVENLKEIVATCEDMRKN